MRRGLLAEGPTIVTYADHSKLAAMTGAERGGDGDADVTGRKRRAEQDNPGGVGSAGAETGKEMVKKSRKQASDVDLEIESLLSQQSTKEQQSKKVRFRTRKKWKGLGGWGWGGVLVRISGEKLKFGGKWLRKRVGGNEDGLDPKMDPPQWWTSIGMFLTPNRIHHSGGSPLGWS